MPSRWLWITAIVLCAIALLLCAVVSESQRIENTPPDDDSIDSAYRIIGVWNGHVAVYMPQTDMPETVYDTAVASLPESERQKLHEGIAVNDREALVKYLEDYLS